MANQTTRTAVPWSPLRGVWPGKRFWFLTIAAALAAVSSGRASKHSGTAVTQTIFAAETGGAKHLLNTVICAADGVFDREAIKPGQASEPKATRLNNSADQQRIRVPIVTRDDRLDRTPQPYVPVFGIRVVTGQMESTLMVGEPIVRCGCR
ncbi:MAG: hypothetical protein R3C17_11060 [Planctomycetaceae bacterium]